MRRLLGRLFPVLVLLLLAGSGFIVAQRLESRPRTDDAFLEADVAHVAPDVSGRIVSIGVRNNQSVQAGDVLFTIDAEPYRLRLANAQAQSQVLEARIEDALNEVASQVSRADAAHTAIGNARAQLSLAVGTLARLEPLLGKGYVTELQVDQARTARDSARVALDQAIQQAGAARQAVGSVRPLEAQLTASRVAETLAKRDLDNTAVKAPFEGKVVGLNVAVGEYASAGHAVFTLIDTSRWYAVANFRETEIKAMTAGTPATVYLMAQPEQPLSGHIESVGWGVLPEEASRTGDVPRIAKTLDWVRLAQRFPVRVLLDSSPPEQLRIGASAVVVIRHDSR